MSKLLISILFCTLIAASCTKDKVEVDHRAYEYFNANLKATMNFTEIKSIFGDPNSDIGSGIHIYVYKLSDSTEIWIGYTDHILYARHLDVNQQLLHTLI
jgi:hypothetical protein